MRIHPFLLALLRLWCERQDAQLELWVKRIRRQVTTPEATARALEQAYGVPMKSWRIERTVRPDRTVPPALEGAKREERGRPSKYPEHRFLAALRKRGLSLSTWCKREKEVRATWSARVAGRYRTPPAEAKRIAALFPGEVSAEDFAEIYRLRQGHD